MSRLEEAVAELQRAIVESDCYQEYRRQLEQVKEYPELKAKIDDFRKKNYELQQQSDYAFDKLEQFEREYKGFREDPLVSGFLAAELALCRMMQEIDLKLVDGIEFE